MTNKSSAMKLMLLALAVLTLASACLGQSYWKRTYGGTSVEGAGAITPTPDGNFIVTGGTGSFGAGGLDAYILKIKPDGDTLWTKTYGGTNYDCANGITPTPDGNFIVVGDKSSYGSAGSDVYILKIKPDGDTLWTKRYHDALGVSAQAVTPTPDGNFIIAGYEQTLTGNHDVCLLKIKPDGDTLWKKRYGGTSRDEATAIISTSDGNFLVAGITISFGAGGGDAYLLKIKPDGDTLWTKTYGGASWDQASAITPTSDGNFIVVGYTYSFGAGNPVIYLLKINSDGDTLWTKRYGGTYDNWANAITPTSDGNFIIVGTTNSFTAGSIDVYLLKIKPDGDTLWTKRYGGPNGDGAGAIAPTPDGNFIVAGSTNSSTAGTSDIWLISIVDDRYAYKDSLFTFKIPVYGDSLIHFYMPLKVPSGMTVSLGGTITWTPKTDSTYMDHAEFLVSDDFGKKDTLTFNIFVNSKDYPVKTVNPIFRSSNPSLHDITMRSLSSREVRFSLPSGASSLRVYDVRGQLLENLSIRGNQATWQPRHAAGRYFAKAIIEKKETVKPFVFIR
jgi:uncharacterized delta-60 repeat protein